MVVIHGWGMNSTVWEKIRSVLESQFFVIWIDLPGHGKNQGVVANSLQDIVDLVAPVIPNEAHLLGWSLGGLICQAIAKKLDESNSCNIKTMTLLTSTPKFSQSDNWKHAMSFDVLSNFSKKLEMDIEGTIKRFIALQFMGVNEGDSKEMKRKLVQDVLENPPKLAALKLGLIILLESDFRGTLLKTPKHWILAERDRLIPREIINDLKLLYPNDQITLLKNTGHAPFMTHPEEFMSTLTRFINAR